MCGHTIIGQKSFDNVSGETIKAIEFYKEWLADSGLPCVFGGCPFLLSQLFGTNLIIKITFRILTVI